MNDEWDKYIVDDKQQDEWEQYAVGQFQPQQQMKDQFLNQSIQIAPRVGVLEKMIGMFKAPPEEQIAEAQNAYAISQSTGIPMREVVKEGMTQRPDITGMMRGPTSKELLQSQAALYGGAGMAATAVTSPLMLIKGLPGATIGYAVGKLAKPFERIMPKETPAQIKELGKTGDELISMLLSVGGYKASSQILGGIMPKIGLGNYAKNKTLAVRKGALETYKQMQKTYGKDLASLSKNPEKVDPVNAIGKMEQMIEERMPLKADGKTRIPPNNPVDSKLFKVKESLYAKWANTKDGKLTVGDIVDSLKQIKDSGGTKNRSLMRLASKTQGEILEVVKSDINVPKFQEMQNKYRIGMNELEAIDKAFDIWEDNPVFTARGERFIKGGVYKSKEAEGIAKLVTRKTGQSLKLGKVSSKVNQLMANRILRYLAFGAAAGVGFKIAKPE